MEKKRSAGRPKAPASDLASSWLQVRVRQSDKARWVNAAQRQHQNLSEWVIAALIAAEQKQ